MGYELKLKRGFPYLPAKRFIPDTICRRETRSPKIQSTNMITASNNRRSQGRRFTTEQRKRNSTIRMGRISFLSKIPPAPPILAAHHHRSYHYNASNASPASFLLLIATVAAGEVLAIFVCKIIADYGTLLLGCPTSEIVERLVCLPPKLSPDIELKRVSTISNCRRALTPSLSLLPASADMGMHSRNQPKIRLSGAKRRSLIDRALVASQCRRRPSSATARSRSNAGDDETFANDEDEDDNCCPICLRDLNSEKDDIRRPISCSHIYHKGCISGWLEQNETCPLCRTNVLSDVEPSCMAPSGRRFLWTQSNMWGEDIVISESI